MGNHVHPNDDYGDYGDYDSDEDVNFDPPDRGEGGSSSHVRAALLDSRVIEVDNITARFARLIMEIRTAVVAQVGENLLELVDTLEDVASTLLETCLRLPANYSVNTHLEEILNRLQQSAATDATTTRQCLQKSIDALKSEQRDAAEYV